MSSYFETQVAIYKNHNNNSILIMKQGMNLNLDFKKNPTELTRKDMTHSVISIDSILLNSMRNGKIVIFSWAKQLA